MIIKPDLTAGGLPSMTRSPDVARGEVVADRAGAEGWGEDKLDADYASGDSLELEVASGTYDLHAEDCDGEVVDDREDVEIVEGTTLLVG